MNENNTPIWQQYMPDYVDLYYVDYRDSLDENVKLLEEVVQKNNFYPLSETIYDWWDYPEEPYLNDISQKMREDGLEDEYENYIDDIREWLWNHDESTPVEDLIRNTGNITCFYSLGIEVDPPYDDWGYSTGRSEAKTAYQIRRRLGVKAGTVAADKIDTIIRNAPYGGELRVYFAASLENLVAPNHWETEKPDFKSIRLKGPCVIAIHNAGVGSCDLEEEVEVDVTLPFDRDNLHVSRIEKYSIEETCGFCNDWCDNENVTLSFESVHSRKQRKSKVNDQLKQEAAYDAAFKAGKCTFGDMDISRHRDVKYDNGYPAGNRCPHCGTFWVD